MSLEQDVNKALVVAGNQGRYQYVVMLLLCVIFYFDVFLFLGPSFYFMDPTFICDGSDEVVDESIACSKLPECHITNDFTITRYLGLYCDRQDERDLIQSLLSVGSLIGLIIMNFVSDLRGRRLALIIDLIIAVCSISLTLIGTYAASTPLLIFASIMSGFSGYSLVIVSYIIAADICEEEMRQKSSLYMNLSYSLGLMTFFIMYNWMNQWYNVLVLFMLMPFAGLGIISFIIVQQSPNYYLCKRKQKSKCIDVLTSIAIYNGKGEEQIEQIQKIIQNSEKSAEEQQAQKSKKTVFTVLKQWQYLKIVIFVSITEAGGNLLFYGIQYAIDDIGFNYGVDNLVLGATEVFVTIVLTRFISKLPRKKTLIIAYLATVAISFVFLIHAVQESNVICTILIILIRTSTTIGYFMIVMFQTQSFPLQVQSIGAGTIEAFAQLGSISAPLIIAFAVNNGLQKMATLGVVLLVCLIPIKFVPEPLSQPKKDELSESILESQLQPATQ